MRKTCDATSEEQRKGEDGRRGKGKGEGEENNMWGRKRRPGRHQRVKRRRRRAKQSLLCLCSKVERSIPFSISPHLSPTGVDFRLVPNVELYSHDTATAFLPPRLF